MSLLNIQGLDISFKTAALPIKVVNQLSLDIKEGEVFGLAGESGCGKSLTALAIMGLLPDNSFADGLINFKNRDLLTLGKEEMRRLRGKDIAMIFQEPMTSLNPVLTIGYQIKEVLITHLRLSKREATENAIELLKAVKISSPEIRVKEYPHQMSGGMRQRVMIAMGLACNPQLLIADEPTTALDVTIQLQILNLLRKLRKERKMSLLLITHDLGILSENADTVAIMYAGRLMELAATREIFSHPGHPYTIGLLNSIPKGKGLPLKPIPGFVPRPGELPEGCKFSDRCAYVKPLCREKEPEIRDVSDRHLVRCVRAEEIA